jgi:hypothetical protein
MSTRLTLRLTRTLLLLVGLLLICSGGSRWGTYWTNASAAPSRFGENAQLQQLKVAPPSPMDVYFSNQRSRCLQQWSTAPRDVNGLPVADVGFIHTDVKRLPLATRVSGNQMEISKFADGVACYYDAGRRGFLFVTGKAYLHYAIGFTHGAAASPRRG